MTVLDLLRPFTSHNAQKRGWEYLTAVDRISGDARAVSADVRGTETYDVSLRVAAGTLRVWCDCPYFDDRGSICKHLWATAALAIERGLLGDVREGLRIVLDFDDEHEHEILAPDPVHVDMPSRSPDMPYRSPVPLVQRPDPPPSWRVALAAVTPATPAEGPSWIDSRLIYRFSARAGGLAGEVPLDLERYERKRDGGWSKPQPARLTQDAIARLPDADDRWALSLVYSSSGLPRTAGIYGWPESSLPLSVVYLRPAMLQVLWPRLCPTGRVHLHVQGPYSPRPGASDADAALSWDDGAPWRFGLVVTRVGGEAARRGDPSGSPQPVEAGYRVDGVIARGDTRIPVARAALLTNGVIVIDGRASRFDAAGGLRWAAELRTRGPFLVPARSRDLLVESIVSSGVEDVDLPDEMRWEDRTVPPGFLARIDAPGTFGHSHCRVTVEAEYGETRGAIGGPTLLSEDRRVRYRRDEAAERRAIATLKRHGVTGLDPPRGSQPSPAVSPRQVAPLVHALVAHGWRVEAEGFRYRAIQAPRLRVRSGIDWFEIDAIADADADLAVDLPDLLKAIGAGRRTVTLGDGTIGMLPEEWLARIAPLLSIGESGESGVRFKPSQVALIDALLAGQEAVDWDEGFARARQALARFEGVRALDPPATFHGVLREYQRESLGWMQFLRDFGFGGCLADDMGLGKTVMVLAMLESRRLDATRPHRPSLVVLPRSLLFNWTTEAGRFAPGLRVLDFAGADRHSAAHAIADADVVFTTYGTLRRDVLRLQHHQFDYVVLDEAQAIKNASTASAKAVRLLRADHRLTLTGTPVENHLGELHSLFDFLNPGLLGKAAVFNTRRGPGGDDDRDEIARLARGLRPFFLRRTKEQVTPELPPRTEETLYCELEGDQLKTYRELRDHYRRALLQAIDREGLAKARFQILEALLRLRQAACHTDLLPGRTAAGIRAGRADTASPSSAKFDLLLPRLVELVSEGRKALVFSQFTSLLALLRERLDADGLLYAYLDGATRDRAAVVAEFQDDLSCPLFLISLKAGGVGLNLTAAEYVFLLDPWWNPAVEMQAIDRTHRIGQAKPVFAYRLVARDTVEERILELQSRKRALADAILEAGSGGLRGLQREDLEQLLS